MLMNNVPGYELRMKALIFKYNYKKDLTSLQEKIDIFFKFFDWLLNSKTFYSWLEIILSYGNYLNGASNRYIILYKSYHNRGGAYGFKLDILTKIADFKSNDNKKNILLNIVE